MKSLPPLNKFKERFFLLPVFLFTVFIIIFIFNLGFKVWNENNILQKTSILPSYDFKYPILKNTYKPQISATGAIIMDAHSKIVLFSKNPNLRFSTASTAKLMTALVSTKYFDPQDILTVKIATKEGSILGLFEGETMTFENLLYAMLLPSANDAAFTIAQNYPNGVSGFVAKMNQEAKVLSLPNTHYLDPAGLLDNEDYTTPFDLARLASFAIEDNFIQKVVSTKEKFVTDATGGIVYDLENLNKLLGQYGVNGVKTGYTEGAGEVLVTSKVENGRTIIIVVMGSADRLEDTIKLLDLVSNNISFLTIHP